MPYFTNNGHRLHYREAGSGPLLLLLHGNTASSVNHEGELAHFCDRFHVVALDFLGTGLSDRMKEWPDDWWAQGARDGAVLAEHLGYERTFVAGTSGGGIAALQMAIFFPDLVDAVIADSCPAHTTPEERRNEVAFRSRRSPRQIEFWHRAHGDDWEEVVESDSQFLLRTAERNEDPLLGRLSSIRCPVLFTGSFRDKSIPTLDTQICGMAKEIPGSQIFMSNDGAHPLMWSAPNIFHRIADPFLDSLVRAAVS
ncbi:MAG TPA: alpha/beta hydrolase [Chloroflexota bacterium]|nr:alpha/beta hydrolase [Chloroflexota bacterium]